MHPEAIGFPDENYMSCVDGLVENHHYQDLRGYRADDFDRMWADEQAILDYPGDLSTDQAHDDLVENEVWMLDLDAGVASTVFALLAIGAVPVTCCNGRPGHRETHPLVYGWCSAEQLALIEQAASETGVTVDGVGTPGVLIWHPTDIEPMRSFARRLVATTGPGTPDR